MLIECSGRNDVGARGHAGSVRVDEVMKIERYSHVMHIMSKRARQAAPGSSARRR